MRFVIACYTENLKKPDVRSASMAQDTALGHEGESCDPRLGELGCCSSLLPPWRADSLNLQVLTRGLV